jgi:hypothetical protein
MFLVDDILMAPVSGVLWIFQEIYEAAEQERANEADNITVELQKLYRSLESGSISEEDFEAKESELLDRLDSIEGIDSDSDDELEDDEQEDQEDQVADTISEAK